MDQQTERNNSKVFMLWMIISKEMPPTENPIKCNDTSISRPLIGDADSFLAFNKSALSVALPLPIILIIIYADTVITVNQNNGVAIVSFMGVSLATHFLAGLTADLTAKSLGVLAPNFLAVCQPDVELLESQCSNGSYFVHHVNCTNHPSLVTAAGQACPSIWVTAMTCSMTTLFLWASYRINGRINNKWARLCIRSIIQLVAFTTAISLALVTYFRNEGDWIDVSAGFIWGAFVSGFTFYVLLIGLLGWNKDGINAAELPLSVFNEDSTVRIEMPSMTTTTTFVESSSGDSTGESTAG